METKTPLFKGATRPACIWGVPMKPFLFVTGVIILLGFWVWIPLMLLIVPAFVIMHFITKDDDQRFLQLFLYLKINLFGTGNKIHWGGVRSLGPVSYKKIFK